jgi:sigma-B regulation protein RsbU (phosphoserine phosphatase)
MKPATKNDLRARLLARRQRLEEAIAEFKETAQLTQLLKEIDSALERMDKGPYGMCEVCHESIEEERLRSDPLVGNCLGCLTPDQQRALEQDLDLASRIQTRLLPNKSLSFDNWQAYYHYEAAGPVSGDYCDLVSPEIENGNLFFMLGDVSGKGVAASILMSHLHAIFHSLLDIGLAPDQLVQRANRIFCDSTVSANFATLVFGRAAKSGAIDICNAGHCPPLVVRENEIKSLESTGLPLGVLGSAEYKVNKVQLSPGDSLLLYSDGLIEARDKSDTEYGTERLAKFVKGRHGLAPKELIQICLEDLNTFLSGARKTDDLTIMVIQRAK